MIKLTKQQLLRLPFTHHLTYGSTHIQSTDSATFKLDPQILAVIDSSGKITPLRHTEGAESNKLLQTTPHHPTLVSDEKNERLDLTKETRKRSEAPQSVGSSQLSSNYSPQDNTVDDGNPLFDIVGGYLFGVWAAGGFDHDNAITDFLFNDMDDFTKHDLETRFDDNDHESLTHADPFDNDHGFDSDDQPNDENDFRNDYDTDDGQFDHDDPDDTDTYNSDFDNDDFDNDDQFNDDDNHNDGDSDDFNDTLDDSLDDDDGDDYDGNGDGDNNW